VRAEVSRSNRLPKYVYIVFVGARAPISVKTRAQNQKRAWAALFEGVQVSFEVPGTPADVTMALVTARLDAARGGAAVDRYVFGTGNDADLDYDELEAQRLVDEEAARAREAAEEERRQAAEAEAQRLREEEEREAAARAREAEARKLAIPRARHSTRAAGPRPSDVKGFDFSALSSEFVVEDLNDTENPRSWVVCRLDDEARNKVVIEAEGRGGLDEVAAALRDDGMQYACIRVFAVDRSGSRASLRTRLVYLEWTGEKVSSAERFKNNDARAAFESYFSDAQITLKPHGRAQLAEQLTEDNLTVLVRRIAGAHSTRIDCRFGFYDIYRQADDARAAAAAGGAGGGGGTA
jgi:Cofilin/tropomyosin-type actin-binding protein